MLRKLFAAVLIGLIALALLPSRTSAQAVTVTLNGTVKVVTADIIASNGVVHVIDGVLVPPAAPTMAATMSATNMWAATMPATMNAMSAATMAATMSATMQGTQAPSIADIVASNPDFSILLAALQAAGLTDTFAKPGTYTVFAPTNEAFTAFLKAQNMSAADALGNKTLLTSVLTYHVLGTVVKAADLAKLTSVTTLNGAAITVSVSGAAMSATSAAMNGSTLALSKNDKLGAFLVAANGLTLYTFAKDTAGVSNCNDKCASAWPALTVDASATPVAGTGVTGKLGTITRADGKTQVTYNGKPLYFFAKDKVAGDTNGQAVGNVWYVVAP